MPLLGLLLSLRHVHARKHFLFLRPAHVVCACVCVCVWCIERLGYVRVSVLGGPMGVVSFVAVRDANLATVKRRMAAV